MTKKKTKPNPDSPERFAGDELLARLAQELTRRQIGYVVIGGQAVNQHGHIRTTVDIDFTIDMGPWDLPRILELADANQLTVNVRDMDARDWVMLTQVLPCAAPREQMGVDFSFVPSPYIQQAIERGVWFDVAGQPVRFLAIEDLLLQKVIANRAQDHIDVVELLVRHSQADFDYIQRWLTEFAAVLDEPLVQRFGEWKKEADA